MKKKKILLIDDDRELCGEMAEFLADEGYAVSAAFDGRAGASKAERRNYALLILDLKMPGIGGLELLSRLRAKGDATPVIVISGSPLVTPRDADDTFAPAADRCALRLADAVIPKPFDMDRLLETIRRIVG